MEERERERERERFSHKENLFVDDRQSTFFEA
jgi:hypothetical protein